MNHVYIGDKKFDISNNQTYIMGILNVTPDSFSDGAKYNSIDTALKQVERMIDEGASIIDIGGESTRPGYKQISVNEEIDRVIPVIEQIKQRFDIPVSIDTYKYQVAEAACKAKADMVNDIWGLLYEQTYQYVYEDVVSKKDKVCKVSFEKDKDAKVLWTETDIYKEYAKKTTNMAKVIAKYGVSVCMMHNDEKSMESRDINIVINRLKQSIEMAVKGGIDKEKMLIDPGIGFAKSYMDNLYVMKNADKLHSLEVPILLGVSNKSMIGIATDTQVEDRMVGSVVAAIYGVIKGCNFIRVHDVAAHKKALDMIMAIENCGHDLSEILK